MSGQSTATASGGRVAWPHVALGAVGSTNVEARARLAGEDRLWVTAERQTAGLGRRGRTWVSEPGNLYASVAMRNPVAEERLGLLPLACAVALIDAVSDCGAPADRLTLKWPNDLMLDRLKTAGILLDATIEPDGSRIVVAGFGVNVHHAPSAGLYPATTLSAALPNLTAAQLFARLSASQAETMKVLAAHDGAASIVKRWLARAQGVGEPLTVRYEDHEEVGTFAGLDAEGYLLLQQAAGAKRIMAGDIFFSGQATPNRQEPAQGAAHTP